MVAYSRIMEFVLGKAKEIQSAHFEEMTVECFLLALLENQSALAEEEKDVEALLGEYGVKVEQAKSILKTKIEMLNENKTQLHDANVYFQKMMYFARRIAAADGVQAMPIRIFLSCAFKTPNNCMNEIMGKEVESQPQKAQNFSHGSPLPDLKKSDKNPQDEMPEEKETLDGLTQNIKRIRAALKAKVFGQDNAIDVFTRGYFQACLQSMTDKDKTAPKATFLFAGPPGVGKTYLAETIAKTINLPFQRFDMSGYADKEANLEFAGTDKVYKNGKAGNVTGFVAEHPKCVLLFDEIEKAHISVIHLFLQILDAGRVHDAYTDKDVSFKDAVIILTTNAGKQLYMDSEQKNLSGIARKVIIRALETDINPETQVPYFPGAICSRFASGNVVMFNHITAHHLWGIAKAAIEGQISAFEKELNVHIDIDDKVYSALLFSEGGNADARTVKSRAATFLYDELFELMRLVSARNSGGLERLRQIQFSANLSGATPEIVSLFHPEENSKILVLAQKETADYCRQKLGARAVVYADTVSQAIALIKQEEIGFALVDILCNMEDTYGSLNIEDVDSEGRRLLKFLDEQNMELPVYLLETALYKFSEEEKISYLRQGVRGFAVLDENEESFEKQLDRIATQMHQQASMDKLSNESKVVRFESAQRIDESGAAATIALFDFKLSVAVDSEDQKNVLSAVSRPNVKFDEVIGADAAKEELTYFVAYLKNPKKYMGTGVKAPRGVLLYGAPGTGKTLLAKAMASEAGVTFVAAEGNQFLKKYVGEGSEEVHELFRTARKYAPSILFVDEIDAIGKERKGGDGTSGAAEATLTAFLTEMDGFSSDPTKPVFVLAATNFEVTPGSAKSLDSALLRRFDRRLCIELPNKKDRIRFLKQKKEKLSAFQISDEKVEQIALRSTGMSLAELDSVVELSLRSAIRVGEMKVTDAVFDEAFETFNSGEKKHWDPSQLEQVAVHEAGHALICSLGGEIPSYLTIVARGSHGGYMQHAEQEGKALYTKEELLGRIRTSLGGRAAELVYYGAKDGMTTGASSDLEHATSVAERIVCTYGMDEGFGMATIRTDTVPFGAVSDAIREKVNAILDAQLKEAVRLITENKAKMDALVETLMDKNQLSGDEIKEILQA